MLYLDCPHYIRTTNAVIGPLTLYSGYYRCTRTANSMFGLLTLYSGRPPAAVAFGRHYYSNLNDFGYRGLVTLCSDYYNAFFGLLTLYKVQPPAAIIIEIL